MKSVVLCPSAKCKEGAELIGVVNQEGEINLLKESLIIDENFVAIAKIGRNPEARFRFADKCMKGACSQWTGARCGIIDKIINYVHEDIIHNEIPDCSIRPHCRWFNQIGYNACKACPLIVTDVSDIQNTE